MGGTGSVLVTGATGLVGARLLPALARAGRPVRALSRSARSAKRQLGETVVVFEWDGVDPPDDAIAGSGAVVHLAGEPVFGGLPTDARRRRIRASRLDSTAALVRRIASLAPAERPATLVSASAVGYYGDRGEELLTEESAPGEGFLADLCREWEAAAAAAAASGVRVVMLRLGIVLAREGGALPLMARPFRLGLGGRLGDGRQWVPWIHIDDVVALILAALGDESLAGPVNATSPQPARNADLTRALAHELGRPALLPVPAFALRAALGDVAVELLGSRRVDPARARAAGFAFAHPALDAALERELG